MKPSFILRSPETGTDYHIYIEEPPQRVAAGKIPAILFMDGDDQFSSAVKAYKKLQIDEPRTRPLLLVGVGYGASYRKPQNKRARDYTPTAIVGEEGSGGANPFLTFLSTTLWEELSKRHQLSETERGIAGHSLGSLLALYALFQPKPFFNRALVSSPSVWWDDRSILKVAQSLRDRQSVLPAKAFLSVGEEDTPSMTGDLSLLEQQLSSRPFEQLELTPKRYPNKDHYNAIDPAFEDGLRVLFAETP
ncbi:MAG TPA: alpha/beta hydrolase-fold protein [Opitutaceae bacterium]